ncbi:MAG: PilC/PilY family type IV pilus protein, partial [Pseudomonadota bacterium]
GIPFTWNSLSSTQQLLMRINPITNSRDAEATGQNRVLYVRGQSSFENFRERKSPLGDIINSTPTYVNQPSELYTDLSYITFRENLLNRRPALYVGANDGMLHGFDAETGQELFAYIPSTLIKKLPLLSATNYAHEYFVDGQLATRDVYINGQWRTYLVGGLRAGGQTFFALDITNPSNYQESNNNAKALVKWEFTDRDDPDLGYTFSTPVITQMNNGKWVAIFGNGYNNTENDDDDIDDEIRTISATGNAVLYIIDLATGELLHKLDTQVGTFQGMANGLASPAAIDANQDGKVDWIYAGDLLGNLWKFDVTSENKEQWSIAGDGPLFQAKHNDQHQPITVRPDVSLHPSLQGFILYFGTGRYFANNDNDSKGQTTQSFYAIWDNIYSNRTTITQDSLLQQNVLQEVSTVITTDNGENISYDFRITSEHPISWYLGAAQAPPANVHLGWFIHLTTPDGTNRGERQVTYPKLRNGRIVFTTLIPTEVSCEAGGEGWLMELDAFSGARLESPAIDINEDGKFNINDTLTIDEISTVISGYKLQGVPSSPAFLNDIDNNSEIKAINLSSGVTETFQESADPFLPGRQSWREIR